jgi:hypothetical protein
MTTFDDFLDAINDKKLLNTVITETTPIGNGWSRDSPTLNAVLVGFFPDLGCELRATSCLLVAITANALSFDNDEKSGEFEKEEFREKLMKLRPMIQALHPVTSTQRGAFTKFSRPITTHFILKYPDTENLKFGPHVSIIRSVLHADLADVLVHEAERAKIKRDRVSDLLEINSHEASFQLRKQYNNNIEDLSNVKKEAALLLSIQGSAGCRKGEVYKQGKTNGLGRSTLATKITKTTKTI